VFRVFRGFIAARQAAQFTLNPRNGLSTLAKVNESKIEGKSSCPAFGRTRFADW